MNKFAIGDQKDWCAACGNQTGVCAGFASTAPASSSSGGQGGQGGSGGGVSRPVAGVIGAVVTLAVVLGVEGLVLLVAGFRVVGKGNARSGDGAVGGNGKA